MNKTDMKSVFKIFLEILLFPLFLFVNPLTRLFYKKIQFIFWSMYESLFFRGKKGKIVARRGPIDFRETRWMIFLGRVSFGKDCKVECYSKFNGLSYHPSLIIGENTSFGDGCHIGCVNSVTIGNNVLFGSNILIIDHNHGDKDSFFEGTPKIDLPLSSKGAIVIGNNCWIGEKAIILPGTNIGDNSVIGAGSVVSGRLDSNSIYIGSKATKLNKHD